MSPSGTTAPADNYHSEISTVANLDRLGGRAVFWHMLIMLMNSEVESPRPIVLEEDISELALSIIGRPISSEE